MHFRGTLSAIEATFKKLITSPNRKLYAVFAVFVAIVYAPFLLHGGFQYDDWAAAGLSHACSGLVQSYRCFWPGYPDRPLASLYYSINSNLFHMWSPGYIFVAVGTWITGVLLMFNVFKRRLNLRFATVFLFIAATPSIASTIIFSPAMQSIGAFSFMLWAASFYWLDKYLQKPSPKRLIISFGLMFSTMLFYESSLPLFALSAVWPYIISGRAAKQSNYWLQYFKKYIAPIGLILLVVALYQKLVILHSYAYISKVRFLHAHDWFDFMQRIITNDIYVVSLGLANFCLHAVSRLRSMPGAAITVLLTLIVMGWALSIAIRGKEYPRAIASRTYHGLWLGITGIGFFVACLHFIANSPPTLVGYLNRGLVGSSIIVALVGAMLWEKLFADRGKYIVLLGVLILGSYTASFVVQRSNYDAANKTRLQIQTQALPQINKVNQTSMFVLADVPEYTPKNFDNETIYSDEVLDWGNSLAGLTNVKSIHGISLSPGRLSRKELVIENGKLNVMHGTFIEPISDIWFYNVSAGKLIKVQSVEQLQAIFANEIAHPLGYRGPVDGNFRNNLRNWLASY